MGNSLRTRIWFCFSLLFGLVLCLAMLSVAAALRNSPVLYRTTLIHLRLAEAVVSAKMDALPNQSRALVERFLTREADNRKIRLLLVSESGNYLFDTSTQAQTDLLPLSLPLQPNVDNQEKGWNIRDENGGIWFYTLRRLDDGQYLMAAVLRPKISLRAILRDEFIRPFLRAGLIAVLLIFLLSLWLSQWITKPIKKLVETTQRMEINHLETMDIEGPQEVRQLIISFNQMTSRLAAGQKAQNEFLANVSHELKTPLTSIQGFAQAIQDGTAGTDAERQNAAGVILAEAERMHRLVLDLLELTRLESGTLQIQHQPLDLGRILAAVVEKFSLQARRAGINLGMNLPPLPTINGDGDRLAQVFTNLVENGLKFTPAGGVVQISAKVEREQVIIEVQDNGIGISADDQKHIFERFYQVDKSRRGGAGRGVGLGLAIAQQIILAHGGTLQVRSEPGQGSIFSVHLPVSTNP